MLLLNSYKSIGYNVNHLIKIELDDIHLILVDLVNPLSFFISPSAGVLVVRFKGAKEALKI
jgi:hypothetical protein